MKKYITIQNILIFVLFIMFLNGFWLSNRKNYYKREMFNNFHQRDSFAAVARLQQYELEALQEYVKKTDYYRDFADSLWNEMLSLDSTFETQHKIIKRNRKNFNVIFDKYQQEKQSKDTITITIIKYKEVVKEKKPGFFKRLFRKKN